MKAGDAFAAYKIIFLISTNPSLEKEKDFPSIISNRPENHEMNSEITF